MNEPRGNIERIQVPDPERKEGGGGKGALKWVIVGAVALAVAAVAVWKFLPALQGRHGLVETAESTRAGEPTAFGEVIQMEDIVINPAGSRRVFMVTVTLEVANKESIAPVQKREALLRDNLITLFASQPLDVLIDIKYRPAFRARVKKIMDYQLGEGTVTRVFFEKWVFQ